MSVEAAKGEPFDAGPLDADEWVELLRERRDLVMRTCDGTREGTYRFWVEAGELRWRALTWTSSKPAEEFHLDAALDGDVTAQLLIELRGGDS